MVGVSVGRGTIQVYVLVEVVVMVGVSAVGQKLVGLTMVREKT